MGKEALFGLSLFPYLGFLWLMTRSRLTPRLALIGFYTLLLFVGVTIPAGLYAQVHYGQELANVDWLHGSAESFLTLTNILVVLGFSQALQQATSPAKPEITPEITPAIPTHPTEKDIDHDPGDRR